MFGLGRINVWIRVGQPKWKGFGLGKEKKRRRSSKMLISPQVEVVLVLAKKSNTQS